VGTLGIVDFRYEIPTANLAPERSQNIELGYKLQSGKWNVSLAAYYMHLNNLITRVRIAGEVIAGYPVYKKENVEEGYIKGFETEVGFQPLAGLQVKGNLAYTYGQSLSKNEPLRRIPPFNGRLISTYHHNKCFASAEFLFASRQSRLAQGDKDDNRIAGGGTPGWDVFNLYAGYQLSQLKFNLSLQNLLDEDYRTHGSGINGVGRSAWLSVAVTL
jgi:hemoglobin/transferrin/lactoferrin receptor protein